MTTDAAAATEQGEQTKAREGYQLVANRVITDIYAGLTTLSQRRLEAPKSPLRVATLLRRYFAMPHTIYLDAKNAIIASVPTPDGWTGTELPASIIEQRMQRIEQLNRQVQEIEDIPSHLLIRARDLPLPLKGDFGDQNQFGVGDIVAKLHFVFAHDDDALKDQA